MLKAIYIMNVANAIAKCIIAVFTSRCFAGGEPCVVLHNKLTQVEGWFNMLPISVLCILGDLSMLN